MPEPINEGGAEEVVEVNEIIETKDEQGNDTTDWKAIATEKQGIARRLKTKVEKFKTKETEAAAKVAEEEAKKKETKPSKEKEETKGLDRIDKAVLRTEKITEKSEVELVESIMKETGKDLEGVLESKYFQGELKELREENATKEAMPDGTKRSGASSKDNVDYWIAKGELPPHDQPELRTKVVNAKIAKEKNVGMFSKNPVTK